MRGKEPPHWLLQAIEDKRFTTAVALAGGLQRRAGKATSRTRNDRPRIGDEDKTKSYASVAIEEHALGVQTRRRPAENRTARTSRGSAQLSSIALACRREDNRATKCCPNVG
jgi:hypothetical protein